MSLNNQKGVSLMQTVIFMGIVGALSFGIVSSINLINKRQRNDQRKTEALMLRYELQRIFANPETCACNVLNKTFTPHESGTGFTMPILDKINFTCDAGSQNFVSTTGEINNVDPEDFRASEVRIANLNLIPATGHYSGQVQVVLESKRDSFQLAPIIATQVFEVVIEADGVTRKITDCGPQQLTEEQKSEVCSLVGANVDGGTGKCVADGSKCSGGQMLTYDSSGHLACKDPPPPPPPPPPPTTTGGSTGGTTSGSGACSGSQPSCPPPLGTAPNYCSCGWLPPHTTICTPTGWQCTSTCDHSCEGE